MRLASLLVGGGGVQFQKFIGYTGATPPRLGLKRISRDCRMRGGAALVLVAARERRHIVLFALRRPP